MKTIDCIKSRKSVRKFLDKEVSDDVIMKLFNSAIQAPYGGGPRVEAQLWEFILVKNNEIKDKLTLGDKDRKFVKEAPIVIVVCADKNKDPKYKNWDISMALAIENLLLLAHDLGLGACYVDTYNHHEGHKEDRTKLVQALNLPNNIELIAIIPVGYPDPSEKIEKKELRNIKEMIHLDKWNNS